MGSVAYDLNGLNMAVGDSGPSSSSSGFIYVPRLGTMVNLNAVLPVSSGWVIQDAEAINNQLSLTGYARLMTSLVHLFPMASRLFPERTRAGQLRETLVEIATRQAEESVEVRIHGELPVFAR